MDIRVLEFKTKYTNGKEHDWVLYAPASNIKDAQTWERVDRLKPLDDDDDKHRRDPMGTKKMHMKAVWSFIEPAYKAWKSGNELPETGTPLVAWSAVNAAQVAEFKKVGIKTVEDVAGITDGVIQKIKLPQVARLRGLAVDYLASADSVELAQEVADTKEQLAVAMALMEQMKAEMNKPKRTRRTKAEMQSEEAA